MTESKPWIPRPLDSIPPKDKEWKPISWVDIGKPQLEKVE